MVPLATNSSYTVLFHHKHNNSEEPGNLSVPNFRKLAWKVFLTWWRHPAHQSSLVHKLQHPSEPGSWPPLSLKPGWHKLLHGQTEPEDGSKTYYWEKNFFQVRAAIKSKARISRANWPLRQTWWRRFQCTSRPQVLLSCLPWCPGRSCTPLFHQSVSK